MHNNLNFTDKSSLDIAAQNEHSTVVKKLIETYEALKHLDDGKFKIILLQILTLNFTIIYSFTAIVFISE